MFSKQFAQDQMVSLMRLQIKQEAIERVTFNLVLQNEIMKRPELFAVYPHLDPLQAPIDGGAFANGLLISQKTRRRGRRFGRHHHSAC